MPAVIEQENEFPGLVPLIESYVNSVDDVDVHTRCTICQYLSFISQRASGMYQRLSAKLISQVFYILEISYWL